MEIRTPYELTDAQGFLVLGILCTLALLFWLAGKLIDRRAARRSTHA